MKQKKNILVIDDDNDLCELMTIILSKGGYEVKTLKSVGSLDGENLPDAIILDVLFLGEDGRTICKRLKTNNDTKHVPILMYSAGNHFEEEARKAGADDFIRKPFEIKELLDKIKKLL